VVRVIEAGDALLVDPLADALLADVQQRAGVVGDELRVTLEAQHLVLDAVGGDRAEVAGGQHRGVRQQLGDLILVTYQQGQFLHRRLHPGRLFGQPIAMDTDAPALARALAAAA